MKDNAPKEGLELLRKPFPPNQISKLPKPTRNQTEEVKNDFRKGIRCPQCGAWHHPDVVHLDYVGHAALTDRLLDCDPLWNWAPLAFDERGQPMLDANGGMWIKLTVCGHSRLGYGHADGKKGGDAVKEVIGDALRNAAMRFGAALDLWHKGDLHGDDLTNAGQNDDPEQDSDPEFNPRAAADRIISAIRKRQGNRDALQELWTAEKPTLADIPEPMFNEVKGEFSKAAAPAAPDLAADEIPY